MSKVFALKIRVHFKTVANGLLPKLYKKKEWPQIPTCPPKQQKMLL